MMPLTLTSTGEKVLVGKIGGRDSVQGMLERLGFVVGAEVYVIAQTAGNIVVNIRESRVAVSREAACRILVTHCEEERLRAPKAQGAKTCTL
ncbi:MAG: ferrous iron transport protein A [Desulfovibrio sp.]|jgi:ferrous iron transport protein A|nr:ferrous iron transport protein A [Desulfovibrio sp.]